MQQLDVVRSALSSLDSIHLDTLLVLALDAERPWSRSHWEKRAAEAGIVDEKGRKIHGAAFKAIVERLNVLGATVRDASQEYALATGWVVPVVEDGGERQRLLPIARGLRTMGRRDFLARSFGFAGLSGRGELLVALASHDAKAAAHAVERLRLWASRCQEFTSGLFRVFGTDVPLAWLALLEPAARGDYLKEAIPFAFTGARPIGAAVRDAAIARGDVETRAYLAMTFALAGEAERARAVLESNGNAQWTRGARGFVALTEGRLDEARDLFAVAGVGARGQRVDLPGPLAVFDVLLAVTSDRSEDVADVERRMEKGRRHLQRHSAAATSLIELTDFRRRGTRAAPRHRHRANGWIDLLVTALADTWIGTDLAEREGLRLAVQSARANGYAWLADEIERIVEGRTDRSLLALFGTKEGWQLTLESLRVAVERAAPAIAAAAPGRAKSDAEIWWTLENLVTASHHVSLEPYAVAKRGAKGKRLSVDRILDELSGARASSGVAVDEADRRVAEAVRSAKLRHYLLPRSVLVALVGHPRVRDGLGNVLSVESAEPKLEVDTTRNGARMRLVPARFDDGGIAVERDGDRLRVFARNAVVTRILEVLPPNGLVVPPKGRALLTELLGAIGGAIGIEATATVARETVKGDPRIHVQLFRGTNALRARLRIVPGGADGPALRPGAPPVETVVPTAEGLARVVRDLAAERAGLDALLERCPTLASLPQEGDDRIARDLETCLELLVELREASAIVEWREGQPLRAPSTRDASQLRVRVKGDSTWLAIEGDVRVDEERVLGMRELLECASRATGRFVPIGEDEFLALTDDLMKRLGALGRLSGLAPNGALSAALLPAVDAICKGLDVSFDGDIAKKREALERTQALEVRTPRGLVAELRDYQRDGFQFLARRTEAGLGACLADDMGLGKTVQALALLLHRRKIGPALVVAPTSVCRNWEAEASRFAPALALRRFGEGERKACIEDAKKSDVVIASYGLLAAEEALLASRTWGTVVFDEAHALKNATTRRWSAARSLKSAATVALTGTPVENHARELHALFDLLVPGMLGSRAAFERVLGSPIGEGDREAASLLRNLVRPFVLRRTKSEVLSELPPKTEVLQVVPATKEHLAFYEAVRRRAIEKIEAAKRAGGASAGRARIDLLAEIMRLRRAAIDPRLVGGDEAPPGGKIEALVELVVQLRAEGRRALVFSQFLEVLDLAGAALEASGVECLRLDGTMSASARAERVATFQGGRGDAFLVSLKAGGVGMNLTGADVVILLDPWWNPAVEDQAAGRAHRIGQTRPVTVARLVTEHTIEEKVLALHAKKRRLYEDVISEADGTGTLDVDAIVALLSDDPPRAHRQDARGEALEV